MNKIADLVFLLLALKQIHSMFLQYVFRHLVPLQFTRPKWKSVEEGNGIYPIPNFGKSVGFSLQKYEKEVIEPRASTRYLHPSPTTFCR